MSVFGDIERFLADIYPYRWPILAAILVVGAATLGYGYRSGWHLALLRRWKLTAVIAAPLLVLVVLGGWKLAAPLFVDVVVEEEFPFDLSAVVIRDASEAEAAETTAGVAKVDVETSETSPDTPSAKTTVGKATPEVGDLTTEAATTPVAEAGDSPPDETATTASSTPTEAPTPAPSPAGEPEGTPERVAAPDAEPESEPEPTAASSSEAEAAPEPTAEPTATPAPEPTATAEPTATPAPEPTATAEATVLLLKSGSFRDADSFHKGSGTATIFRGPDGTLVLRLEDFGVTNGPDLHVYLSPHPDPQNPSQVKTAGYVDLGELKGNVGNQNYFIPEGVDVGPQQSVVIYCVPFSVVFSVAPLQ